MGRVQRAGFLFGEQQSPPEDGLQEVLALGQRPLADLGHDGQVEAVTQASGQGKQPACIFAEFLQDKGEKGHHIGRKVPVPDVDGPAPLLSIGPQDALVAQELQE